MRLPSNLPATVALLAVAACSGNHDATVVTELRFGPPAVFPLGTPSAQGLAFTDLDGDGFLDALSTDRAGGRLVTLRGTADGFATAALVAAVPGATQAAVGDLNGDRLPDAIVGSSTGNQLAVLDNLGAGAFASPRFVDVGATSDVLLSFDFSGDMRADIVAGSAAGGSLALVNFDGTSQVVRTIALGAVPGGMTAPDLNLDGKRDLVVAAANDPRLFVLLGTRNGYFAAPTAWAVDPLGGPVASGDVDGDGLADVVALDASLASARVFPGNGTGSITVGAALALPGPASSLQLADLDGDGNLDLCASLAQQVVVSYGKGDGTFRAPEEAALDTGGTSSVVATDIEGDGRMDLAYVSQATNLALLRNPRPVQAGNVTYGTGSPDCMGFQGLLGTTRASVGNAEYALRATNALPYAVGTLLVGNEPVSGSVPGPLGGVVMHVGPTALVSRVLVADASGSAFTPMPIPDNPDLAGVELAHQVVWFQPVATCSPNGFSSSRGLLVRIR